MPSKLNRDYQYNMVQAYSEPEECLFNAVPPPTHIQVFFSRKAQLEKDAQDLYFSSKNIGLLDEELMSDSSEDKLKIKIENDESFDRLDSRGKMMHVRKTKIKQEIRFLDS